MSTAGEDGESSKETNEENAVGVDGGGGEEEAGGGGECSAKEAEIAPVKETEKASEKKSGLGGNDEGTNAEGSANAIGRTSESSSDTHRNSESLDDNIRFNRRRRSIGRQYRRRSGADESSGDEHVSRGSRGSSSESEWTPSRRLQNLFSSSSSDSSRSFSMENDRCQVNEDDKPTPKALLKCKPKHKWFAVREIIGRETGWGARWQGPERFQHRYYGSLHAVQRLELMYKLDEHRGCVNSLHFNRSGELLASASDDKRVVLWDWAADRSILSFDSGHTGNVFQAKFLPLSGDRHIVTCARDGQVRLSVLSGVGVCKGTRLLAQHRRTTHKLAIHHDTPHVFLSAGEDAMVLSHDVRTSKASKLLFVKEGTNKVGLYSIHSNPVCSHEFIVTGEDQYIRLYDKRKVSEGVTLNKFCPVHLLKPDVFLHVTCAVFNYNGTEVIGSYNDDDIYLFDTRLPPGTDYQHKYEGHRNSITVKGVNFFGPRSEFVVSGSDCGNIFFWDKSTEAIVQWMRGDEEGVVNCLEPHPQVPIIATSGLDNDIKIWVPSCEQEPSLKGLKSAMTDPRRHKIRGLKPLVHCRFSETVIGNQSDRDHSRGRRSDPFDNRQMRWLWRQIQRFEQRRFNAYVQGVFRSANEALGIPFFPVEHQSTTNTSAAAQGDGDGGEEREQPRSSPGHEAGAFVASSSSSSDDETESARPQCSPS